MRKRGEREGEGGEGGRRRNNIRRIEEKRARVALTIKGVYGRLKKSVQRDTSLENSNEQNSLQKSSKYMVVIIL